MSAIPTGCAFDARGNMLWSHDGRGRTAYAYDAADRLTAAVYPDGRYTALRYDHAGNLAERQAPSGARDQFAYDTAGRLTDARYAGGTTISSRYDDAGRLLEVRAPGGATRYSYDADGRPVRMERTLDGQRYIAEFAYNADGHLTGARVPGFDAWLRYGYDEQRRLVSLGYDGAPDLVRLAYDADSRQVLARYANGVTQRFALDRRHQIQQIRVEAPTGAALLDLRYRAGAAGNITALGDQRYTYDDRGRLVAHGPLLGERARYRYDHAGNRLEMRAPDGGLTTYRYDAAGRLVGWTPPHRRPSRCGYDGAGNLVRRLDGGARWSYRYDGAGRMLQATCSGGRSVAYGYDHDGRRVLKRAGATCVITHRDPWGSRLAETTADGATRVYLGPAGQPLACLVIRAGRIETLFLHLDHLGSIRAVTDAAGNLAARYDFDPWGNRLPDTGPAAPAWLHVFAGHPFDADLGMYDCGVRLYDPAVGRFISADTYTFAADDARLLWLQVPDDARRQIRDQRLRAWQREGAARNRYVYALNNPLTYVDRDGHSAGLYILYTLLSIFWALPYTLVGFLFFEVWLNWITFAWLWDSTHEWSGESSDRLGAWSWWTIGGISGRLVIGGGAFTLGNFVIANADFMRKLNTTNRTWAIPTHHSELVAPIDTGKLLTERESVIEHELRHTNQYGWWGPFMMPWVLVLFFVFQNLVLTGVSALTKAQVNLKWADIWKTLTDTWWQKVLSGVGILLLPGAYWWDYMVRGGYAASAFEQDAGQRSGSAFAQNVRASASQDSVAPNGTAIISVITANGPIAGGVDRTPSIGLSVTTSGSGTPSVAPSTPAPISNLRVFTYTAGPNKGTDILTATDGASTVTLEIDVA